jgi:uncharacterized cofD-like protein
MPLSPTPTGPIRPKSNPAHIVVLGGGTGSFAVLSGLRDRVARLTAIVSMSDDGGSTGRLCDELGVLPPGDVRQCLVALSRSPKLRDLFNYRFADGALGGHSFGNLFLAALEHTTGDFASGVALASEILQIAGTVEPVTLMLTTLCMDDHRRTIRHERNIDDRHFTQLRPDIWLDPLPTPNPRALAAIRTADLVVIAPGSLYTSLGALLSVPDVGQALRKPRVVYFCNLVNKPGQTDGFSPLDYADELERIAGAEFIDTVIYNSRRPAPDLLQKYLAAGEIPLAPPPLKYVRHYRLIGRPLLATTPARPTPGDRLPRTLIRHDPARVARTVLSLI